MRCLPPSCFFLSASLSLLNKVCSCHWSIFHCITCLHCCYSLHHLSASLFLSVSPVCTAVFHCITCLHRCYSLHHLSAPLFFTVSPVCTAVIHCITCLHRCYSLYHLSALLLFTVSPVCTAVIHCITCLHCCYSLSHLSASLFLTVSPVCTAVIHCLTCLHHCFLLHHLSSSLFLFPSRPSSCLRSSMARIFSLFASFCSLSSEDFLSRVSEKPGNMNLQTTERLLSSYLLLSALPTSTFSHKLLQKTSKYSNDPYSPGLPCSHLSYITIHC